MTVPYLLRFCPFRALMCMLFGIHTQGVASLALGYALVGLSARSNPRVSLRLPWAMRLLGFQPALTPGCRFACHGLCAHWAFSPLYLNQKRIFIVYILLFAAIMSLLNIFCCVQYCCYMSNSHCLFSKSLTTALNPEPPERVGTGIVSMSSSTVITPPRNSRLTWSVTSKTKVESLPL